MQRRTSIVYTNGPAISSETDLAESNPPLNGCRSILPCFQDLAGPAHTCPSDDRRPDKASSASRYRLT